MGIASRTKWERRVNQPIESILHIDPAKLAHGARLVHAAMADRNWNVMLAGNASRRQSEACDALENKRRHKRKARLMRGWLPYAQR